MLIDSFESLSAFCERASRSRVLAVDTEFLRERTYYPKLCLVQVGTAEEQAAIDVLSIRDLSPLKRLLFDETVTKVFHSCSQDLEVLCQAFGDVPRPIFDTQLAAGFLGQRMQIGYAALVAAYTGVRLDKADTLTDWSKRPLDKSQLVYAEDDVRYLPGLYESMMAELVEKDRLTWVLPEMGALTSKVLRDMDPRDAYLHVKKFGALSRPQLAICREVAAWRERCAQRRDIPRKWVVSDEVLVEICKRPPRSVERLRRIRGTQGLSESDADAILLAVKRGRECPPRLYPESPHSKRPAHEGSYQDLESVVDLMYAMTRLICDRAGVAVPLVAKRDDLCELACEPESSKLSEGWRHDLVGTRLEELLRGEAGLTVKDGRLEVI